MNYKEYIKNLKMPLNPQQEAAVQTVQGPVLLLAVPGSGKTTVLVSRLGYMLHCGISPKEILVITYTVSATNDMRQRFNTLLGYQYAGGLEFRTINSMSNGIIRHYQKFFGADPFELITEDARIKLIGDVFQNVTGEYADENDKKDVQSQITYIKNICLTQEDIDDIKIGSTAIGPIYREYCQRMRENRQMDYDDQMVYAHRILLKYPKILEHFKRRYRYIFIDEAQDASKIQHLLVKLLAGDNKNIFMVGDEDQSIFGFRAAYPQALLEFNQVYPNAKCLLMEHNYRSTKQIVEAANAFIQKNKNRHPKQMVTDNTEGEPLNQVWVKDRNAQYEYLADIAASCSTETAILYRDNESAIPMIDLLERRGHQYCCKQLEGTFFKHKIVRDITDILRFAYAPADYERFEKIYYKISLGINKVQMMTAIKNAEVNREPVLEHVLRLSSLSEWSQKQAKALITHFAAIKNQTAEHAVNRIINFMGYAGYLSRNNMDASKLDILTSLAEREETPKGFLERLNALSNIVARGGNSSCPFILSTFHSSKGLEYDKVILADVIDNVMPKIQRDDETGLSIITEEERRLFYVAMTRAKKELSVIRFRKEGLKSTFAQELFPIMPQKQAPSKTQRPNSTVVRQTIRLGVRQPMPTVDTRVIAKDFIPKARVRHKVFGFGVITAKDGMYVTIRFNDGTEKRFDLNTALRIGVFSLVI